MEESFEEQFNRVLSEMVESGELDSVTIKEQRYYKLNNTPTQDIQHYVYRVNVGRKTTNQKLVYKKSGNTLVRKFRPLH